jgi:tRNA(Ile)-lysidine synthase
VNNSTPSVSISENIVVGVSGGADSVALLLMLRETQEKNIVVAHFNHQLRGEESNGDELFVKNLSKKLGLIFERSGADIKEISARNKVSLETAARDSRYEFFAEVAKKYNTNNLFIAHHADDQIETCLFNLLRGTGMRGLGGMKKLSSREVKGYTLKIHRPLLDISKKDILHYLKEKNQPFREDSSNKIADASRNKLRLKILPLIEKEFGDSFKKNIQRTADILQGEEEVLNNIAKNYYNKERLQLKEIKSLHPSLQKRIIHGWIKTQGVKDATQQHVDEIFKLLIDTKIAKINLPKGWHGRRKSGEIFLEKKEKGRYDIESP